MNSTDGLNTSAFTQDLTYLAFRKDDEVSERQLSKNIMVGHPCGGISAVVLQTTGVSTAMHELGHQLAYGMLYHGDAPHVQVDGIDNFHAIKDNGINGFVRWIGGYDHNHDGNSGVTTWEEGGTPNHAGKYLGDAGRSAAISVAGSIPALIFDTLAINQGLAIKRHHPVLGGALIGYGATNHLLASAYPIDAACMSHNQMHNAAENGHDFANLAVQMHKITGVSTQALAIGTAVGWTLAVPLITLGLYISSKSEKNSIVSDYVAIQQWLLRATLDEGESKEQLNNYLKTYPELDQLQQAQRLFTENPENQKYRDNYHLETHKFADYLTEKIPEKTLNKVKEETLEKWQKGAKTSTKEKCWNAFATLNVIALEATKIIRGLSETVAPSLQTAAGTLTSIAPVFAAISIIASARETYNDLKCDSEVMPAKAKLLSVAKFIANFVYNFSIIAVLFLPGINLIYVISMALGGAALFIFSLAKNRALKHHFEVCQAVDRETLEFMRSRYKNRDKTLKLSKGTAKWIKNVNEANKMGLLSEELRMNLVAENILKPLPLYKW